MPRGVRRAGLAALLLAATLIAPAGARGQAQEQDGSADPASEKRAVDQEHSRLVQRYDETLALEAERTATYQLSVETARSLAADVTRLEAALTAATKEVERAEAHLESALAAERRLRTRLADARRELQARLAELRESAVVAYVEASELGSLRGLSKAFDDQQGAIAVFYAGYVGDITDDRVEAVEQQEERIEQLVDDAEDAAENAEQAATEVAARRDEAQQLRDERQAAREKADAEAARQQQLVAEVVSQRERYEHEMHALENESARLGDLLRQQAAAAEAARQRAAGSGGAARPSTGGPAEPPPPARTSPPAGGGGGGGGGGQATSPPAPAPTNPKPPPTTNNAGAGAPPGISVTLSYPLPGWPVVSKYGWRVHPILGVKKLHEGIDIWAPAGTGVAASAGGSVVWVGPRNGYGNAVVIDHGGGVGTLYAHLSGFNVSNGQSVSRGATVGFVGQTGLAAGPHLHFEVRVNGDTYNPLAYMRAG